MSNFQLALPALLRSAIENIRTRGYHPIGLIVIGADKDTCPINVIDAIRLAAGLDHTHGPDFESCGHADGRAHRIGHELADEAARAMAAHLRLSGNPLRVLRNWCTLRSERDVLRELARRAGDGETVAEMDGQHIAEMERVDAAHAAAQSGVQA